MSKNRIFCIIATVFFTAGGTFAAALAGSAVTGPFAADLATAQRGVDGMLQKANQVKLLERQDAKMKVERMMAKLGATLAALETVPVLGRDGWFLYEGESCPAVCEAIGLTNVPSPEGALCASGEVRPASAIGIVQFKKGCWPNCAAEGPSVMGAQSIGGSCYKPGQKRDNDRTDVTMGCFCQ